MDNNVSPSVLLDLLALPTAPLNEGYVVEYVRRWAAKQPSIALSQDAVGNIVLRLGAVGEWESGIGNREAGLGTREETLKSGKRQSASDNRQSEIPNRSAGPLVLCAHMDHPGFEARRMVSKGRVLADWLGWVHPDYFKGTKVRFFSDGRWVRGVIRNVQVAMIRGRRRPKTVEVEVKSDVRPGSLGMWDLPEPVIRGGKVFARGCDDVAGVAAILEALDSLSRSMHPETLKSHRRDTAASGRRASRRPINVMALLTRAEEIGFAGAIAACRERTIPPNARVVAVETSSEIPGVRMGDGPILRVGDAMAIFSPGLTGFCGMVAADLAKKDTGFKFQRKLMDGGTCESTVYHAEGYDATGLCIALGNYHNMDTARKRIASEYIHLADWEGLVRWFVALATTRQPYDAHRLDVEAMVRRLARVQQPQLERTAGRVGVMRSSVRAPGRSRKGR